MTHKSHPLRNSFGPETCTLNHMSFLWPGDSSETPNNNIQQI